MKFEPVDENTVRYLATHDDAVSMFFNRFLETAPNRLESLLLAWGAPGARQRRRDVILGGDNFARGKRTGDDHEQVKWLLSMWQKRPRKIWNGAENVECDVFGFDVSPQVVESWMEGAMHSPERLRLLADALEKPPEWKPSEKSDMYRMLAAFAVLVTQTDTFPTLSDLKVLVFPELGSGQVLSKAEHIRFKDHWQKLGIALPDE